MTVVEHGVLASAIDLVDVGVRACAAHGRADLASRLTATRGALAEPAVHVVVVGDFKQGKSSLVNALVGVEVCPVDDNVATARPAYVRHGDVLSADVLRDGSRVPVEVGELPRYLLEGPGSAGTAAVEIRVPSATLAGGVVLVDTPGVGGLGSVHGFASLAALSTADAALFVTDAEEPLNRKELDFLRRAKNLCGTVVGVLTKTDFYPGWRGVRAADEQALAVPIVPVSVPLRLRAVLTGNAELDEESGFASLARLLADQVAAASARRLAATAAADVVVACDQLAAPLHAERAALAGAPVVLDQRVDALAAPGAAWQQAITAGVAALALDIDADLRGRVERVVQEAQAATDSGDPADTWPQTTSWLQSWMAHELIEHFALVRERARGVVGAVDAAFAREVAEAVGAADGSTVSVDNPIAGLSRTRMDNAGERGMLAAGDPPRFTMLDGLVGVVLDPIDVGIGLVMGHQGLREEKERQRLERRTQAKNAVRRYCDEVGFVMGRDAREVLGRVEHGLRERYRELASELGQAMAHARTAVSTAAALPTTSREARRAAVDTELRRLDELRDRAAAVAT